MEPQLAGWIAIGGLLLLLALRVPVAVALGIPGLFALWVLEGSKPTFTVVGMLPYYKVASYHMTVIPLFVLMGHFAHHAGFATDIFRTGRLWVGHLTGGLVQATIVGATGFAACCGSGLASCATMAKVAIPEMLKEGVDKRLALGTVAAVGPLAVMIPPSIAMALYGIIAEQSIGKLLIAGIIPGIVAVFIANLILGQFHPGFENQPIAQTNEWWNFGGMVLAGLAFTLAGGCPGRQLFLTGEGNADSAIFVIGVIVGAGFAHNFNTASSAAGVSVFGPIIVIVGLVLCAIIGLTMREVKS